MARELGIALLGLGTVGTGVLEILHRDRRLLAERSGTDLVVRGAAVRNRRRRRGVTIPPGILTTDADTLVRRSDVDVVVEVIGGIEPARTHVLQALKAGKHVVTANKALLAADGARVFRAAEAQRVHVGFEASVAGGIPIVRALRDGLAGDRVHSLYGIVNGTCNSILSDMEERGLGFEEALRRAQVAGFAEADPTLDVDGSDAAHKLSLLAMLAFGARCPAKGVHREGIQDVSALDVDHARELGYAIRLLAVARDHGEEIEARVQPTMIPRHHLLADVRGALNAVHAEGFAVAPSVMVGPGAGKLPTAASIVSDLVEIARGTSFGGVAPYPLGRPFDGLRSVKIRDVGDVAGEFYIRVQVSDEPGVLARIAGILGRHGLSIASVLQKDGTESRVVPIVIRTHEGTERQVRKAVRRIASLSVVRGAPFVLRIEDRL